MFLIFMVVLTIRPINHPYDLWKKKNTLKVHCKYKQWEYKFVLICILFSGISVVVFYKVYKRN